MKLEFKMKSVPQTTLALAIVIFAHNAFAQTDEQIIEAARNIVQSDRKAAVMSAMQLTEDEATKFWPLYDEYRAEQEAVGDGIQKLILEYASLYPSVPDDRAKKMLGELTSLEKKQASKRSWFMRKMARTIPASKALRFAQVDARLDLAVRLKMAANIPLVPIEGDITGVRSEKAVFIEGTAGGVYVQTYELSAKVAAIDAAQRKVTLVSEDGIKQTVKVPPEAINFDQISIGDELQIVATEELVVEIGAGSESNGSKAIVALAPKGAKPGGLIAETSRLTGIVTAIDPSNHTATLRFADDSSKTFPVRSDINLARYRVGDKVTFQVTEMLALSVKKP